MSDKSDDSPLLHGGLATSKDLAEIAEIAAILAPVFPQVRIGESSHYTGGRYVGIEFGNGGQIRFERCSGSEYLVSGDSDDPEELFGVANQMAKAFEAADIPHRFEVSKGDELYGGTWYRWEEAGPGEEPAAPMVTISRYTRIEDAQKDAARLAKRGIRTAIVHGMSGGLIAGTGPTLELQVDARDMEKMSSMEDEIEDEIASERPHACPKCDGKNYAPWQPKAEGLLGMLAVLLGRSSKAIDSYLHYHCGDCGCYFKVRVV
jgi:hypothetical protein